MGEEGSPVELREFVNQVLSEIVLGVDDAQEAIKDTTGEISPTGLRFSKPQGPPVVFKPGRGLVQQVEFDIAVTTKKTSGGQAKAGIFVAQLFNLGAEGDISSEKERLNRIKFTIPILLPSEYYNWSGDSEKLP